MFSSLNISFVEMVTRITHVKISCFLSNFTFHTAITLFAHLPILDWRDSCLLKAKGSPFHDQFVYQCLETKSLRHSGKRMNWRNPFLSLVKIRQTKTSTKFSTKVIFISSIIFLKNSMYSTGQLQSIANANISCWYKLQEK